MSKSAAEILEPFRQHLYTWYIVENRTLEAVQGLLFELDHTLNSHLRGQSTTAPTVISKRTLHRVFNEWPEFRKYFKVEQMDDELKEDLEIFFYEFALSDTEILRFLALRGYEFNLDKLKYIRLALGMRRRFQASEIEEHMNKMRDTLAAEIRASTQSYGYRHATNWLKKQGVSAVRERVRILLKELTPQAVEERRVTLRPRFQRGVYTVPGPNFVLSVDGHHKLSMYGFEIYAGIDAYSRYVSWIYVGISTRTAVAILRLYLDHIKSTCVLPYTIRSDRGTETNMMAKAHVFLHQSFDPDIDPNNVYWYGTSTANQRIEAWWGQLSRSQTLSWKRYFDFLKHSGSWSGAPEDYIAMLFVFMPILRKEVYDFVALWNVHNVRRQPSRPHVLSGKPISLYFTPPDGVVDFGQVVEAENPHLNFLETATSKYDPDEYLPHDTITCCQAILVAGGVPLDEDGTLLATYQQEVIEGVPLYDIAYHILRQGLRSYFAEGNSLQVTRAPRNAYDWDDSVLHITLPTRAPEIDISGLHNLEQEGRDDAEDDDIYIDWERRIQDGGDDEI